MEPIVSQQISKRLIVLITDGMTSNRELSYAVHWLAFQEQLPVLYLVMVDDNENMLTVSRDMATMKAVTAANRLKVEATLTKTEDWFETLQKITRPDDVILCLEEQMVLNGRFQTIPIREFLSSHFNSPIRAISGFYETPQPRSMKWFHEVIALFGFLVIVALFTWLQIRVEQAMDGTLAKIFVMVAFSIEMSAIWFWNKFTYR